MRAGYKLTELGEIPEDWGVIKMKELVQLITKGTTPTSIGYNYQDEGVNFIKIESLTNLGKFLPNLFAHISNECNDTLERSKLKKDDLLFSIAGALGRVAIVNEDILPANTNQALAIIRLKDNSNRDFIYQFLKGDLIASLIRKINVSTAQANLSLGDINNFIVPIPKPSEKKKITEVLFTVDEKIEVIEEQINETKNLKKGLIQKLFTKGFGHTKFKNSCLGVIPENWEVEKLETFCKKISVGFVGVCERYYVNKDEGVVMLRTGNLSNGKIIDKDLKYVSKEFHVKNKKSQIYEGDILVARHGVSGQAVLVPKEFPEANCLNIVIIRPSEKVFPLFLKYQFNSPVIASQIKRKTAGSTQGVINTGEIALVQILVPNISEQKKISEILNAVDEKLENLKMRKDSLQELKKGLMQQLLTGKMRVKLNL